MCQDHKRRPRYSEVTLGATPPLDLPSGPNIKSISNEPMLYSGSRNIAKFREVSKIRGEFSRLRLGNGKSYEQESQLKAELKAGSWRVENSS